MQDVVVVLALSLAHLLVLDQVIGLALVLVLALALVLVLIPKLVPLLAQAFEAAVDLVDVVELPKTNTWLVID